MAFTAILAMALSNVVFPLAALGLSSCHVLLRATV